MRLHSIHFPGRRHRPVEPAQIPAEREEPERTPLRELLAWAFGARDGDGFDDPVPAAFDMSLLPPARTAVQLPGASLPTVRPAHTTGRVHVPHVHRPHLPALHVPALVGRILHPGQRPADAPGLAPVATVVPTVPTAAGLTMEQEQLRDAVVRYMDRYHPDALVPPAPYPALTASASSGYLPGDDPRTSTQQLHGLAEAIRDMCEYHGEMVERQCAQLDELAWAPYPTEQPIAPRPPAAPPAPVRPPGIEYPPFATGSRRAPAPAERTRYGQNALSAATPPGRHAGSAAAEIVIGGAR